MSSFLEFVAERLMGPPDSVSYGTSTWSCPRHTDAHPSLRTRPPKKPYKDRFQCWSCGFWGDVADLVREFYPSEDYGQRKARIAALRIDYNSENPPATNADSYSSGDGESVDDPDAVAKAWADLKCELEDCETSPEFALQILNTAQGYCERQSVSTDSLITYWQDSVAWVAECEMEHLAECDDPECDDAVCRRERGLLPLSCEELRREKKVTKKTTTKKTTTKKSKKKGGK